MKPEEEKEKEERERRCVYSLSLCTGPQQGRSTTVIPEQGSVQVSEQRLSESHVRLARKSTCTVVGGDGWSRLLYEYCRQALWGTGATTYKTALCIKGALEACVDVSSQRREYRMHKLCFGVHKPVIMLCTIGQFSQVSMHC